MKKLFAVAMIFPRWIRAEYGAAKRGFIEFADGIEWSN